MSARGRIRLAAAAAGCLLGGLTLSLQAACTAASGGATAALVELYTSEGCSSCPPADKWLSTLDDPAIVALALHVNYWDDLGWRDRFSNAQFSQRQAQSVRRNNGRVVYTPQVLVDGRDFREWRSADALRRAVREAGARPAQARLELSADEVQPATWSVTVRGTVTRPRGRAVAYLAVYENGLASRVGAGENRGATLHHDRVVRAWLGPLPVDAANPVRMNHTLKPADAIDFSRAGIAALIEDADSGEVLQALVMPLCRG
ncbi:MAG: DUF1223 domain-containing protein [Rhodocyclaceae bacterium]